jgi:hypothetical protein
MVSLGRLIVLCIPAPPLVPVCSKVRSRVIASTLHRHRVKELRASYEDVFRQAPLQRSRRPSPRFQALARNLLKRHAIEVEWHPECEVEDMHQTDRLPVAGEGARG